jgi:hypothetical protein
MEKILSGSETLFESGKKREEKRITETSGGSHELLPHLDDGDEGGAAQCVLRILLILLPNHQLFFLGLKNHRQEKTICAQKIGEKLSNKRLNLLAMIFSPHL